MTEAPTIESPDMPDEQQPGPQADYFGFQYSEKHFLPDKVSYFEITAMNEGQKAKFQKKTSSDVILDRRSGDARVKMDQATQRHELITECTIGWNLTRNGQPVPFNKVQLGDFLTLTDPRIVEDIEKAIRKLNPWLLAEMSSDDIKQEIASLEEMLQVALERERGESS